MAVRRTLVWIIVGVAVAVAVAATELALRRSPDDLRTVGEPRDVESGLAVLIIRDSAGPPPPALDSVLSQLRAHSGVRIVSALASSRVDVGQLRELINVPSVITLQPNRDHVDATFLRGDSTQLRRSYAFADSSRLVAAILADAATSLDADIRTKPPLEWSRMDDPYVHVRHADSLFKRGDTLEALREARRAHEVEPLNGEIHLKYAAMLDRSGRDADAARERAEQRRIATILHPTVKDQIARARFKHVPKRPPRSSRPPVKSSGSRGQRAPRR